VSESGVHTNTIEGTWCGVKRKVPMRNRNNNDLPSILLEFIWRRKNADDLWGGFFNTFQVVAFDQ
jgi:hypothetical protein